MHHSPAQDADKHLFIVESAEAGLAAEVICRDLISRGIRPTALHVVWLIGALRPPRLPAGVVTTFAPENTYRGANAGSEISRRFRLARWWRGWMRAHAPFLGPDARIYITLPSSLPGNIAFRRHGGGRLALLPDGMVNYSAITYWGQTGKGFVWLAGGLVTELVAAAAAGLWYNPSLRGHLTQYERQAYDRTYTFDPDGLVSRSGTVITLERPALGEGYRANARIAVIADQELGRLVDPAGDTALRARLAAFLNGLDLDLVYYKPHPRGRDRRAEVDAALRHDVSAFDSSGPIEELVAMSGAGLLVSYFSTCLVTAAGLPGLRRIAVMPTADAAADRQVQHDLVVAFRRAGAEVIESSAGPGS